MLCFCDINLHQIGAHIEHYGSFGIGIDKNWGSRAHGIQPISYVNEDSPLTQDLEIGLNDVFSEHLNNVEANALLTQLKFSKPLFGEMNRNGKLVHTNFHDEHEWRFIPQLSDNQAYSFLHDGSEYYRKWMNPESMNNLSDALRTPKSGTGIKLSVNAINYIFVENDDYVPSILDDIEGLDLKQEEKRLLMSKVVNLQQLRRDW